MAQMDFIGVQDVRNIAKLEGSKRMTDILMVNYKVSVSIQSLIVVGSAQVLRES